MTNKLKAGSLERLTKLIILSQMHQEKRARAQMNKIRNDKEVKPNTTEIQES